MKFKGRISALNHAQYRRYWLGSLSSIGATQLMIMGQGWLVFQLSQSPLMLGYLGAAVSIPNICMTLFGGALADRLNKKLVLMTTSFLVSLLMLIICLLDYSEIVKVWQLIVIAGMVSMISGIDWPTRQAMFPLLIDREDMMSAVALNSILWQSSRMIMPAVGGLVLAYFSTWIIFLIASCGFFLMFLIMSGLKVKSTLIKVSESTLQQITEGLSFIINNRLFLFLFSITYALMFFGSSYMQLLPAFSSLMGKGGSGYGYLMSASGIGSVAGTILVGSIQHSSRLGKIMLASAFLSGLMIYVLCAGTAFSDTTIVKTSFGAYFIGLAAIFTASAFLSIYMIASMTVLQLNVPDHLRGRVMGLHGITYSLMPLGGLVAGSLASVTSTPLAVSIGISIYLCIIVYIGMTQKFIARIDGSRVSD